MIGNTTPIVLATLIVTLSTNEKLIRLLAAPIGVLCLVVYRVDLLRRSVWSASVAGAVECWFGSRFGEARIG